MTERRIRGHVLLLAVVVTGLLTAGVVGTATAQSETSLDYDGDTLTVAPAAGQTISGTTDIEAGSKLSIQLRSTGSSPFIRAKSTTVTDSGMFEITVDFTDIPAGSEFTIRVIHNETELTTANGRVVEATATATTSPTKTGETTADSRVPLTPVGVVIGMAVLALGGVVLYSRLEE